MADWLDRLAPEQREQAHVLASLVQAAGPGIAVAVSRRAVSLVFHKGTLLADPAGLLDGDARYVRQVRLERATAHPEAVTAVVRDAIAHQTDLLP